MWNTMPVENLWIKARIFALRLRSTPGTISIKTTEARKARPAISSVAQKNRAARLPARGANQRGVGSEAVISSVKAPPIITSEIPELTIL